MDELYFEKSKSTYESALHNIGQKKKNLLFSFLLDKYNFALLRAIKLFQKNNQKDANC